MLDVARQKEQIQIENEIKKVEGEESADDLILGSRTYEYKTHPLFNPLSVYSKELKDYILEQRAI